MHALSYDVTIGLFFVTNSCSVRIGQSPRKWTSRVLSYCSTAVEEKASYEQGTPVEEMTRPREKKEDAIVLHAPHMTPECHATATIRGGGRMGGKVAPARHGRGLFFSIVIASAIEAVDEPCFEDFKKLLRLLSGRCQSQS
eukprot:SAG25_NODE_3085_length_1226_cov_0.661047_2_plen_141_part_00